MVATKKYLTNIHLIGDEKRNAIANNILGNPEIDSVENAYERPNKKGISRCLDKTYRNMGNSYEL